MASDNAQQNYHLAYYTGTGGSALAAEYLASALRRKGCLANVEAICANKPENAPAPYDMLILVFPVHAYNAPQPVYNWIKRQAVVDYTAAAVISVSGGGEISPNTASRRSAIKRLQKKGYRVEYENMLVLPSNFAVATPEPWATALVAALPHKAEQMAEDMLNQVRRRTKTLLQDRMISFICELEKPFTKFFGKHIRVDESCTACGHCAKLCLVGNISMITGKPQFANKCQLCLGCIYGCPEKALKPGFGKFVIIKDGYDLAAWQEKPSLAGDIKLDDRPPGALWSGVKIYLSEDK